MGKLLSLIIIIALIYFFIVPKFRTKKPKHQNKKEDEKAQNLVLCECCGTFVSEDEISHKNNKQICFDCEKKEK